MNDHDRSNLNFLLSLSPQALIAWYNSVSEDDHEYAMELMAARREELALEKQERKIENTLDLMPQYADAASVLKRFMLN